MSQYDSIEEVVKDYRDGEMDSQLLKGYQEAGIEPREIEWVDKSTSQNLEGVQESLMLHPLYSQVKHLLEGVERNLTVPAIYSKRLVEIVESDDSTYVQALATARAYDQNLKQETAKEDEQDSVTLFSEEGTSDSDLQSALDILDRNSSWNERKLEQQTPDVSFEDKNDLR